VDDELKSTLRYSRRPDVSLAAAFADHLARGELFDAALAARAMGRPTEAAALFDQANHHAEAAACWQEAGDLKRALESVSRVHPTHALYPSSARLAVEVAAQLNQINRDFDSFVTPWLRRGPKDTYDSEILLELGDLYRRLGRSEDARSVYQRLLKTTLKGQARSRLDELSFGSQTNLPAVKPPPAPNPFGPSPNTERNHPSLPPPRAPQRHSLPPGGSLLDSSELGVHSLGPGSVIAGRYRLEGPLGSGGSAIVFQATDMALDEEVAIKLFTASTDPEQKARFRREINLARKLAHDHILRIFELVLAKNVQGITMELVDGVTLDVFVDESRASFAERRDLLVQAARGVGYAHRHGVVHRDIKPSNLLVRRDGVVKVGDFGIAKLHEEASITVSGSFHGTPYYVSPEQITNFKSVDARGDIYSLGVVAYELFTNRVPHDGNTVVEILVKHTRNEVEPPRKIMPQLPQALEDLLLGMLAKQPDKRPQTIDEVADRLEALSLP
jgi:tetratricopeptide (TPR) repeat protein